MVSNGVNIFDTGDSYGIGLGDMNGRSELLLGQFIRVRALQLLQLLLCRAGMRHALPRARSLRPLVAAQPGTTCGLPFPPPPLPALQEYPGSEQFRSRLHVGTKLAGYPWRVLPSNMVAACKGSLRRLGMEQLSLGQLHWSAANYAPLQVGPAGACARQSSCGR
jgi:pyridoxine 4-dehydrogenase